MGLGDFFKKGFSTEDDEELEETVEETAEETVPESDIFKVSDFEEEAPKKTKKNNYSDSLTLGGGAKMEFVVVNPKDFGDECTVIAQHMLDRKTVVLNLESAQKDASRRIIDFVSGVAFAVKAKIRKVAVCTYVIIPDNSEFTGDEVAAPAEQTESDESGFSF